jgi:undecaprenyl diphosphate synthase
MDYSNIPTHIGIIMDGNGRWAKQRGLPRNAGHKEGAEALKRTVRACKEFGIKYLTVYAFSTENWKRPTTEVKFLKGLLKTLLIKEAKKMIKEGIKIKFLGDLDAFDEQLKAKMLEAEKLSEKNCQYQLNIMLNYGARNEIIKAVNAAIEKQEPITEESFSHLLYTKDIPDPDLIIRTSGEQRISNFLLWQIAYSEFWFTDKFWPNFDKDLLQEALADFASRKRRYGALEDNA